MRLWTFYWKTAVRSCSGFQTRLWWTKTSPSSPLFSLSVVIHRSINEHSGFWLPFGYYLERDADLLTLRRSDHSFVAAFIPWVLDLLEVEFVAWEDAD
jgi:hypothetical protein